MSPAGGPDPRAVAAEPEPLSLEAYYYSFDETGCRQVDEVLAAIADAGCRSHHTDGWTASDNRDDGPTLVEVIQQAAARAAAALAASKSRAADAEARAEAAELEPVGPYRARLCHMSGRWMVEREYPCINGLSAWFAVATLDPTDDVSAMGLTDGAIGTAEDNARKISATLNITEVRRHG